MALVEAWWLKWRHGGFVEAGWLRWRHGGFFGVVVAQAEAWWRCGGSSGGMVAQGGGVVAQVEAWLLNVSSPDICPAVLDLNLASPQPTADCQSPGRLPPGVHLATGYPL